MTYETIIRKYFAAWIENDISAITEIFAPDIIYTECYGPEHHGMAQMLRWFKDWNQHGKVLEWKIKRIIESNRALVAEWYFECEYEGNIDGFDGVTIADFNDDMKIFRLCEFQSKPKHYSPYSTN